MGFWVQRTHLRIVPGSIKKKLEQGEVVLLILPEKLTTLIFLI